MAYCLINYFSLFYHKKPASSADSFILDPPYLTILCQLTDQVAIFVGLRHPANGGIPSHSGCGRNQICDLKI